jgi:hypothetical protein
MLSFNFSSPELKKRVFFIDEISDDYSGFYYLVEGEILLNFNHMDLVMIAF